MSKQDDFNRALEIACQPTFVCIDLFPKCEISDEVIERLKAEFKKSIESSAASWHQPIIDPDMEYIVMVSDTIEVLVKNQAPVAIYTNNGNTNQVEEEVEEYFGKKIASGIWENYYYSDCELPAPSFEGIDVWVSRCDGWLPGGIEE